MQLLIAHRDATARAALARAITGGAADLGGGAEDLEIIESGDGKETMELLLQEDAPRLAVVDWDMPSVDGPELCRLVRDFHLGGHPYIVLLAASRHSDIAEGLEAGANDCLRTPAPAAEIRERVCAGRRFIEVPWERADRAAMLDALPSSEVDDAVWDGLEGSSESSARTAAGGAAAHRKVELEAVLTRA